MITLFEGILNDPSQLFTEHVLTGQEQAALSQSMINGAAVIRVHCGQAFGSPSAKLVQIDCSFYDHFKPDGMTSETWRPVETLNVGVGSDSDLGSFVELQGPALTHPVLACYPTMLRFIWTEVNISAVNYITNFKMGILLSSTNR